MMTEKILVHNYLLTICTAQGFCKWDSVIHFLSLDTSNYKKYESVRRKLRRIKEQLNNELDEKGESYRFWYRTHGKYKERGIIIVSPEQYQIEIAKLGKKKMHKQKQVALKGRARNQGRIMNEHK